MWLVILNPEFVCFQLKFFLSQTYSNPENVQPVNNEVKLTKSIFFQIPEPSKWEKSSETEEDTKDEDLREILKAKSSLTFAAAPDRNKPKVEPKPEPQKKVESDKEEEEPVEPAPIDVDKVIIILNRGYANFSFS